MLRVIGITGGIASGKSTVSHYLISKGFIVMDCDLLTRQSYIDCFDDIKEAFSDCIINNEIIRPLLSNRVFNNDEDMKTLEGIIHPYVREKMLEAIDSKKEGIIFLDIPLLFEAHMEDLCDEIWVVYVNKDLQLNRLMKRNQMDKKTANMRIDSQMSLDEKKKRADLVIDNSTTLSFLYHQIDARLEELHEYIN